MLYFVYAPLPWFRRRPFSLKGVTALATEKQFQQTVRWKGKETDVFGHSVVAQFENGRRQKIVGCHRDQDLAKRICRFITSSVSDVESLGVQSPVESVAPSKGSLLFNDDDSHTSLASVDTSSTLAEWTVSTDGGSWTAVRHWYSPITAAVLLVLGTGLLILVPVAIANSQNSIATEAWVSVGVAMIVLLSFMYTGIAMLLNSTEITWDSAELRQRHFPLP